MLERTDRWGGKNTDKWTTLDKFVLCNLLAHDPSLSGAALRVGIALANHYNGETHRCDPSVARLAAMLKLSERTIQKATVRLEESGWLAIGYGQGNHGTNQYFLNFAHARLFVDQIQPRGPHAIKAFIEMQCPPGRTWFPKTPAEMSRQR